MSEVTLMRIYDAEREAGLEDIIQLNASIRWEASIEEVSLSDKQKEDILLSASELSPVLTDPQLAYFRSILATVGWNRNDDILLAEEIYDARFTPEHKPFTFQHDEKDIIGHIVSNFILDMNKKELNMNAAFTDLPTQFHIGTGFVLYKEYWRDETLKARMANILAEIKEDKWYVSLEGGASDFDYALKTPDNTDAIIVRSNETAFLTKYLKAYGGNGVYKDAKIGRLLRGFRFKGEGLVRRPGNPHSVILSSENIFNGVKHNNVPEVLRTENQNMTTQTVDTVSLKEYETVKSELVSKDTLIVNLQAQLKEIGDKKYTEEIANLKASLKTAQEDKTSVEKENTQVKADLASAKAALEESTNKVKELTQLVEAADKAKRNSVRLSALVSAGLAQTEAEAKVQAFENASDDMFSSIVDLVKASRPKTPSGTNVQDLNTQANATEVVINASVVGSNDAADLERVKQSVCDFLTKEKK